MVVVGGVIFGGGGLGLHLGGGGLGLPCLGGGGPDHPCGGGGPDHPCRGGGFGIGGLLCELSKLSEEAIIVNPILRKTMKMETNMVDKGLNIFDPFFLFIYTYVWSFVLLFVGCK